MRLPCERYIVFLLLRGATVQHVYEVLMSLGYGRMVKDEAVVPQAVKDQVERFAESIPEISLNQRRVDTLVVNFKMMTMYNDPSAPAMIRALLQDLEVREMVESFLTAEFNPEIASSSIALQYRKVVPAELIRLYAHMVWDLRLLTSWELDMLFQMHRNGANYQVLNNMGHQVALFYAGAQVIADEEAALRYMQAAAAIKFKETVRFKDAAAGAAAASRWADIYLKATDKLGPMAMVNKLINKVQALQAKKNELPALGLPELESHSGLSHGLAVLQDIVEQRKKDDTDKHETDE